MSETVREVASGIAGRVRELFDRQYYYHPNDDTGFYYRDLHDTTEYVAKFWTRNTITRLILTLNEGVQVERDLFRIMMLAQEETSLREKIALSKGIEGVSSNPFYVKRPNKKPYYIQGIEETYSFSVEKDGSDYLIVCRTGVVTAENPEIELFPRLRKKFMINDNPLFRDLTEEDIKRLKRPFDELEIWAVNRLH